MKLELLEKKANGYGMDVRLVTIDDAASILKLRTNMRLSQHIHKTDDNLEKQKAYLLDYKTREAKGVEYYFAFSIIDCKNPIGFYRIHTIDFINKVFSIGSWIFEQNVPSNLPILADIIVREFGFEQLELEKCLFDVRRNNKKVYKYHMLFSPTFIREDDEQNNFFFLSKVDFEINKNKILNYII